jgi:hypothetical protein
MTTLTLKQAELLAKKKSLEEMSIKTPRISSHKCRQSGQKASYREICFSRKGSLVGV